MSCVKFKLVNVMTVQASVMYYLLKKRFAFKKNDTSLTMLSAGLADRKRKFEHREKEGVKG